VLGGGEHAINSKKVDVKKAKAKPGKIFVGGLTEELQDEEIKEYFAQFGTVTDCEMPFDKTKNQRKNFCFITFEREETMKELLKSPKQKIGEVEVDVKRATPKSGAMPKVSIEQMGQITMMREDLNYVSYFFYILRSVCVQ
jgi:squid-like protein